MGRCGKMQGGARWRVGGEPERNEREKERTKKERSWTIEKKKNILTVKFL